MCAQNETAWALRTRPPWSARQFALVTQDDYEVRGWSSGLLHFFAFLIPCMASLSRWELPSSEPLVGRSPCTRAASLAADSGVDDGNVRCLCW